MRYDDLRNLLTLKVSPWGLKVIVNALRAYGQDSPEAAEFPEEFWTFVKELGGELHAINFMDEIQKPSDRGLLGGMPKIE